YSSSTKCSCDVRANAASSTGDDRNLPVQCSCIADPRPTVVIHAKDPTGGPPGTCDSWDALMHSLGEGARLLVHGERRRTEGHRHAVLPIGRCALRATSWPPTRSRARRW